MHRGPNWSALRAPVQLLTGWGSRQRRSPTGGCANGMPLKLRTPSLGAEVDSTMPFAVFTRSAVMAGNAAAAQITIARKRKRIRSLIRDFRLESQQLSVADCSSGVNAVELVCWECIALRSDLRQYWGCSPIRKKSI